MEASIIPIKVIKYIRTNEFRWYFVCDKLLYMKPGLIDLRIDVEFGN